MCPTNDAPVFELIESLTHRAKLGINVIGEHDGVLMVLDLLLLFQLPFQPGVILFQLHSRHQQILVRRIIVVIELG